MARTAGHRFGFEVWDGGAEFGQEKAEDLAADGGWLAPRPFDSLDRISPWM
ncbi:MAG: hypothetical protein HYY30_02825 [Chloroflexi bacterium]|nr:hypothetical protein [Chloroflexota bacterium]